MISSLLSRSNTLKFILLVLMLVSIGIVAYVLLTEEQPAPQTIEVPKEEEPVVESPVSVFRQEIIGRSVAGRPIEAYSFGEGEEHLLFVGGIHGGYEWNSVLLAYEFIDYVTENPLAVPKGLSVTIVPSANPDGLFSVTGKEGRFIVDDVKDVPYGTGRFNARAVDLNRNFACKWKPESMWRGNVVSAGTEAFSEPEAKAIRDLVSTINPSAVIFWHSQSNAVYASECEAGILSGTRAVMDIYAKAAGYPAVDTFDAYPITGDAEGWLASIGIPAITVELSTHESIEWERNLAGFKAVLSHYGK